MEIHGPDRSSGPNPIRNNRRIDRTAPTDATQAAGKADQVDISSTARFISQVNQLPDVRTERVEALRQQIADGEYETQERFEEAVRHIFPELLSDIEVED